VAENHSRERWSKFLYGTLNCWPSAGAANPKESRLTPARLPPSNPIAWQREYLLGPARPPSNGRPSGASSSSALLLLGRCLRVANSQERSSAKTLARRHSLTVEYLLRAGHAMHHHLGETFLPSRKTRGAASVEPALRSLLGYTPSHPMQGLVPSPLP
jgi:hypothetical protein